MRADDVERVSSPRVSDDDVLATLRLRLAVEDFVTHDAELLDSWRLDEWLAQFTDDCRYLMPAAGWPDSDPERDLFFVQDDRFLLGERIASMLSGTAWAESPRSTTHHVIGNVAAAARRRSSRARTRPRRRCPRTAPPRCIARRLRLRCRRIRRPGYTRCSPRFLSHLSSERSRF